MKPENHKKTLHEGHEEHEGKKSSLLLRVSQYPPWTNSSLARVLALGALRDLDGAVDETRKSQKTLHEGHEEHEGKKSSLLLRVSWCPSWTNSLLPRVLALGALRDLEISQQEEWIPAFAGMTGQKVKTDHCPLKTVY